MMTVRGLHRPGLVPIDLEVAAGACAAIQGPSGSGKSLLLRAIADLDPNDGDVRLDGEDREQLSGPEWRRRVAYVATDAGWWADSVADHFADAAVAAALLSALGLPAEALQWPVDRLSTGERQRLALARALVGTPRVLLLDEPTSALDERATRSVETVVADRLATGMAVVIVTHDPAQADRLGTSRYAMADGVLHPAPARFGSQATP